MGKIDLKIILLGIISLIISDILANYAQLTAEGSKSYDYERLSQLILLVGILISIIGYLYPIYKKYKEKNNENNTI